MKLFIIIFLCSVGIAGAADVQVRVVRHKKDITAPEGAAFVTNIIALLQSCSVNSNVSEVEPESRKETLRSDSFVQVTFTTPARVGVMDSKNRTLEERAIHEIVVPLPAGKWPGHIYAKSGTNFLSLTKYDPGALKRVVSEPALQLSSVPPYESLTRIKPTEK